MILKCTRIDLREYKIPGEVCPHTPKRGVLCTRTHGWCYLSLPPYIHTLFDLSPLHKIPK